MTLPSESVDIETWRRLYAAAEHVHKLAPWTWMRETDVFGIQFPDNGEFGYVSVMGANGVHYAVTVYLGHDTLHTFGDIQSRPMGSGVPEDVLELPQLMASFEDRDMLEKEDRDVIKTLGLRYRGRNNWPMFRSYRPGFYPWFLDRNEAENLAVALEQTLCMAMRLEDAPKLLDTDSPQIIFVRERRGSEWVDSTLTLPPPEPVSLTFKVERSQIAALKALPRDTRAAEVDFFIAPTGVTEPGKRPTLVYLLMAVEPKSYFILGSEPMQATDGLARMWEEIPARLVSLLVQARFFPAEIRIASPKLHPMLASILQELGIALKVSPTLPGMEDAKREMWKYLTGKTR